MELERWLKGLRMRGALSSSTAWIHGDIEREIRVRQAPQRRGLEPHPWSRYRFAIEEEPKAQGRAWDLLRRNSGGDPLCKRRRGFDQLVHIRPLHLIRDRRLRLDDRPIAWKAPLRHGPQRIPHAHHEIFLWL